MTKTISRYYIDSEGTLYESRDAMRLARFIPEHLVMRLAQEGYVQLRASKGALHADILSGAAIPDRTPPKVKETTGRTYTRKTPEEKAALKTEAKIAKLKAKLDALTAPAAE